MKRSITGRSITGRSITGRSITGRSKKKIGGKWSMKYKKSIDCRHPKGFSQKQHCKYGRTHKKKIRI
jgi:hypothetical protein